MARADHNRTEHCTSAQASTHLAHAEAFLEVARLVAAEPGGPEPSLDYEQVAAALAVLAGVAAADALCCASLGQRSRGQDHRSAQSLLRTVRVGPGTGTQQMANAERLAKALGKLLDLKDTAHYGTMWVSSEEVAQASKAADQLISAARSALTDRS